MAEIRVEKRKPVWPWILGVLLALLIAGAIIFFTNREDVENVVASRGESHKEGAAGGMTENSITTDAGAASATSTADSDCVQEFNNFVKQRNEQLAASNFLNYTHEGLEYLSCSLDAILGQNNINDESLNQKNENIFETAQAIKNDDETHSDNIQKAFDESVDVLESIQKTKYPELQSQVAEVKKAANEFQSGEPTLQQKEALESFFEKASETLAAMRNSRNQNK